MSRVFFYFLTQTPQPARKYICLQTCCGVCAVLYISRNRRALLVWPRRFSGCLFICSALEPRAARRFVRLIHCIGYWYLCKLRPPADRKPAIYICLYHLSYLRRRCRVIKNISACTVQKTVEIYSFFVYRFDILYFRCFNFINSFAT